MSLQIISHYQVKRTRKPHPCWGCAKQFPAGSSLSVCVSKDDEIMRAYWCESCQEIIGSDPDLRDGCLFGELADTEEKEVTGAIRGEG